MIKRVRPANSWPKSLDLAVHDSVGSRERKEVFKWLDAGRPTAGKHSKQPKFEAYKTPDVVPALEALFDRKCAYCESPFVSHPVDVEHWRPKARIDDVAVGAYEWLAMVWTNLLPSCIDCNRARYQIVPGSQSGWVREKQGKGNQFPVANEGNRWRAHLESSPQEIPLILDPCSDEPTEYFDFSSDGILLPRADLPPDKMCRAVTSIRVYALNRKNLVDERRRQILWLELEFRLIRFLFEASANTVLPFDFRVTASLLVEETLDRLRARMQGDMPYSQFVAHRVSRFIREELGIVG